MLSCYRTLKSSALHLELLCMLMDMSYGRYSVATTMYTVISFPRKDTIALTKTQNKHHATIYEHGSRLFNCDASRTGSADETCSWSSALRSISTSATLNAILHGSVGDRNLHDLIHQNLRTTGSVVFNRWMHDLYHQQNQSQDVDLYQG